MTAFLIRRLFQTVLLMIAITALVFFIINFVPGGPFDELLFGTGQISQTQVDRLNELIGLNLPWYERYFRWVMNVLQGDWGTSWGVAFGQQVSDVILDRLDATIMLMGWSMLLSIVIAIPIGVYSAVNQYSWADYLVTGLSYFGLAMPTFWFGIALIIIFSVKIPLLPTSGMYTPGMEGDPVDLIRHMILPVSVLAIGSVATWSRFMRSAMLEVLSQDYLRTARAKGLRQVAVVLRHGARNALIPMITILGLDIPTLFAGAVTTEFIFSWPGMGQVFFQAVMASDWPVVQAIIVITAFLVVMSSLIADVLYAVVDPRIRYA